VQLNQEVFLDLHLTNVSSSLATFKVKTTARDRYLLRPTQDYIPPNATKVCKIVMTKMAAYPDLANPKNLKDKFLVQSTTLKQQVPDLTKMWKDLESQHNPKSHHYMYAETKIKCKLVVPAKYRAQDAEKRGQAAEAEAAAKQAANNDGADRQTHEGGVDHAAAPSAESSERRSVHPTSTSDFTTSATSAFSSPAVTATTLPTSAHPTYATTPAAAIPPAASPSTSTSTAPSTVPSSTTSSSATHPHGSYDELMSLLLQATKELQSRKLTTDRMEAQLVSASESLRERNGRIATLEATLSQTRDDLQRTKAELTRMQAAREGNHDDAAELRRRGGKGEFGTGTTGTLSTSSSFSSSSPTALLSPPAGLTLNLWQLILLALVAFVLGRIFS